MPGMEPAIAPWIRDSLLVFSGAFRRRPDGSFVYLAERPGPEWHAHGFTPRQLHVLVAGVLRIVLLLKPRWRHRETGETCHSRPPDDVACIRSCTLIVVLKLWSWVGSAEGVHLRRELLPDLDAVAVPRTVQRWLRRALPLAAATEHAIRFHVTEKSEPRPESLIPRGRAPPELVRRRWQDRSAVSTLYSGLCTLLRGAAKLRIPTSRLLAGARGRWTGPTERFLI
jgi:hypothetical protein